MSLHLNVIGHDKADVQKTLRTLAEAFGLQVSRSASNRAIISALKARFPGCAVNVAA